MVKVLDSLLFRTQKDECAFFIADDNVGNPIAVQIADGKLHSADGELVSALYRRANTPRSCAKHYLSSTHVFI